MENIALAAYNLEIASIKYGNEVGQLPVVGRLGPGTVVEGRC